MRNLYCPLSNDKVVDLTAISWAENVNGEYAIELSNGNRKTITEADYNAILTQERKLHKVISLPLAGLLIAIAGGLIGYNAQEEPPQQFVYENGQCIVKALD